MSAVRRIGVLGAGTMGAGIAQVAVESGVDVLVHDPAPGAAERAVERIGGFLRRKVEKGQLAADEADAALDRIGQVGEAAELVAADVVIEAIPEDLELKRATFRGLDAAAAPDVVLASNTSSLSIARIAAATDRPERVVGMHFFNPVPLMALVEVIPGRWTSRDVTERTVELARRLGKTPVVAADTPGFIVNRVQRALYLEAFRLFEDGAAGIEPIDRAVRELGFRMGPFELADVVGTDVNLAAGLAIFEGFGRDPRYRPASVQRRVVDAGRLGRKTSAGYYDYAPGGERIGPWDELARLAPEAQRLDASEIQSRVLAGVVNEAASAVADGVATPEAIDTAMRLGSNWPDGPLAWGERIGLASVVDRLAALDAAASDGRYRVTPLLRSLAERDGTFFAPSNGVGG